MGEEEEGRDKRKGGHRRKKGNLEEIEKVVKK